MNLSNLANLILRHPSVRGCLYARWLFLVGSWWRCPSVAM